MADGEKRGPWKGKDLQNFKEFRDAIDELLPADGTPYTVELQVKRNPIHDYRIILKPGG